LFFVLVVDNFLITYGRIVTKHRKLQAGHCQIKTTTIDPSKQPLTPKINNGWVKVYFFAIPAIASQTGGPYNSAPFVNRISLKALV
jgi:hypothetical protein